MRPFRLRGIFTHPPQSPPYSLRGFLLRAQALSLYRSIQRTLRHLPKSDPTRLEVSSFARMEFERNRDIQALGRVSFLLGQGHKELRELKRTWEGAAGNSGRV